MVNGIRYANAKAFIEGRGVAGWQYPVFGMNIIDEAKALADKLGFKNLDPVLIKVPLNDLSNMSNKKEVIIELETRG